jgi:hypothetical protein
MQLDDPQAPNERKNRARETYVVMDGLPKKFFSACAIIGKGLLQHRNTSE